MATVKMEHMALVGGLVAIVALALWRPASASTGAAGDGSGPANSGTIADQLGIRLMPADWGSYTDYPPYLYDNLGANWTSDATPGFAAAATLAVGTPGTGSSGILPSSGGQVPYDQLALALLPGANNNGNDEYAYAFSGTLPSSSYF